MKFKEYKQAGNTKDYFGRDVTFGFPHTVVAAEMAHVHLNVKPRKPWTVRMVQMSRTSNTHLVYCRGYSDPNAYLLITLLNGNAHEKYDDTLFLLALSDRAHKFREEF